MPWVLSGSESLLLIGTYFRDISVVIDSAAKDVPKPADATPCTKAVKLSEPTRFDTQQDMLSVLLACCGTALL
jgi:hypothetical protein